MATAADFTHSSSTPPRAYASKNTSKKRMAEECAGVPNARISTQALSRVFQQLLIWKTLE